MLKATGAQARVSQRTAHAQARRDARRRHERDSLRVARSARVRHRQPAAAAPSTRRATGASRSSRPSARSASASWAPARSTVAAGRSCSARTSRGGISRRTPRCSNLSQSCPRLMQITRSRTTSRSTRSRSRTRANFHVVYDRGNGFTAWGVVHRHARPARAQHRRHRSDERDQRHHHAQLHQHRRRQRRDQGREHRPSSNMTDLAQPFLSRPRRVDRQRDRRRRAARFACSISRSTARTTASASSRTPAAAGWCTTSSIATSASGKTKNVIEMDTHYTASPETTGKLIPEFRDIRLKDVRVLDGGKDHSRRLRRLAPLSHRVQRRRVRRPEGDQAHGAARRDHAAARVRRT